MQTTNNLGKNFERAETGTSRGTGKKLAIKTKLQLNVRKLVYWIRVTFGTEINLQCKYKYVLGFSKRNKTLKNMNGTHKYVQLLKLSKVSETYIVSYTGNLYSHKTKPQQN